MAEAAEVVDTMDADQAVIELANVSDEGIEDIKLPEQSANIVSRPYLGEANYVLDGISAQSDGNTNPNAAYLLTDNTEAAGTIEATGEARWFAFSLGEKSKVSVRTTMAQNMDADLYIFSLDSTTGSLNMIGGSTNSTLGEAEYYSAVLEAGTYFAAVSSYEGAGEYSIAYFQTNVDIAYEVNDTLETAYNVTFGERMVGVIDCPCDVDIYRFTVEKYTWIQIVGSYPSSYEVELLGYTAEGDCQKVDQGIYSFAPGTYWFMMSTKDGGYSSSAVTYSLNFQKSHEADSLDGYMKEGQGENTGIQISLSEDKKLVYVNGHRVDIGYSYIWDGSNDYGQQLYDISIVPDSSVYCSYMEIVRYKGSTHPMMKYAYEPAVLMTFKSPSSDFYKIDCQCSGKYAAETVVQKYNFVTVLVDPSSGKMIDIYYPNFYYSFSHAGTNYCKLDRNYDSISWK